MRWFLDIITVLGFLLTALGTYLTARSGAASAIMQNELITYGLPLLFFTTVGWFHWFRKYQIAKSVFNGRTSITEAHIMASDFSKNWANKNYSIHECITEYSKICQLMAKGFRQYHDTSISITVKYVNQDADAGQSGKETSLYVKDLCRDIESNKKRAQRVTLHKNKKDYITANSDFAHIYKVMNSRPMDDVYFFSNCLPCCIGYKNTHIHKDWNVWWKRFIAFLTFGLYCWDLPYKSTIIVPISSTSSQGCEYIEGFLCADSTKPFVFSKKYDLVIMQEMAGVLYTMTNQINHKHLISKTTSSNG